MRSIAKRGLLLFGKDISPQKKEGLLLLLKKTKEEVAGARQLSREEVEGKRPERSLIADKKGIPGGKGGGRQWGKKRGRGLRLAVGEGSSSHFWKDVTS